MGFILIPQIFNFNLYNVDPYKKGYNLIFKHSIKFTITYFLFINKKCHIVIFGK